MSACAVTILTRKDLIRALRTVKPALASSRDEVLSSFWFTGKTVMAYNENIAISAPCETDFAGAVTRKLLALLNRASKRHSVELAASAGKLVCKAGFHMRFPLRPPEEFQALFTMPTMPNGVASLAKHESSALLGCIAGCMRSFGARRLDADQLGLTVIPNGKSVEFFTTNGGTISKASLDIDLHCKRRVIIPDAFCKQALAIGKRAKSLRLRIADDHALMVADDVTLYGHLLDSEKPYDFASIIEQHFPSKQRKQTVPIPKGPDGLKFALERALVFVGKRAASEFVAENGYLNITSGSKSGEVHDQLEFDTPPHGVKASFEPELLLAGIDEFDQMLIATDCCVMTNARGELYLVSASVPRRR